jgi:hypothetical protein
MGLSDSTAVFCRIFLSDILNQKSALLPSTLCGRLRTSRALSIIEQKPIGSGPLSLLSYHLGDPKKAPTKQLSQPTSDGWRNDLVVKGSSYSLFLAANQTDGETFNTYTQTQAIRWNVF